MSDLISRQAAIDAICTEGTRLERNGTVAMVEIKQWCVNILEELPSADRPTGEWIDKGDYAECSNCGGSSGTQFDGVQPIPRKTKFCPHCGAKMFKGGEE